LNAPLALGARPAATGVIGKRGAVIVVARHLGAATGRRPPGRAGPQDRRSSGEMVLP
jgi:hypothetical protein